MKLVKVRILNNLKVGDKCFKLSFNSPWPTKDLKPGQFLEVKVSDGLEPLLRRPFSIHSIKGENIEVLYEVVGEGTEQLSRRKRGETLDVIGPLGNGFSYKSPGHHVTGLPVLVAGGIGVAPLVFLAEKLKSPQIPRSPGPRFMVLLGAKTKSQILCENEFKNLGCEVKIATDDGSKGYKGFVTELLNSLLSTIHYPLFTIYACGPKPMLKETASIAARHKIPCQVLLEEYMACGIGACLGCAVKVRQLTSEPVNESNNELANSQNRKLANYVYKMVCKDGPVFEAGEVVWD